MSWQSFDEWLQRVANIVTILGLCFAVIGGYIAYRSLAVSLDSLTISREQIRPRLKVSGRVFIDRGFKAPKCDVVIVNRGPTSAQDVSIHFEAIFTNEVKARTLGQIQVGDIDIGDRPVDRATLGVSLVEWISRAMPGYDPKRHGPSKVNVHLRYRDITGTVWGGTDENGHDRQGAERADLELSVEK